MITSANLDLVRSIFVAWERGDFRETNWAHREIQHEFADGPNPGAFTGMAGMAEGWREFLAAWENYRVVADEYRELDDERVLVFHHRTGRGKASGMELGEMRTGGANLLYVRDGKVTKMVIYFHRDRALADLGLEE